MTVRKSSPEESALSVFAGSAPGVAADFAPPATVLELVRLALPDSEFPRGGEVGVRFAGRAEIAEMNERFRGKSGPTDVLSFAYESGDGRIVGDIAVCPEIVRENAQTDGADYAAMMAHAVAHGALHLAGRRHDTADEARKMAADEARILGACGFARPDSF